MRLVREARAVRVQDDRGMREGDGQMSLARTQMIALGCFQVGSGGPIYILHNHSEAHIATMIHFIEDVAQTSQPINVDSLVRDRVRLDSIEHNDGALRSWPDDGPVAVPRPPIGSSGRISPVNAVAGRVMGTKRKKRQVVA